MVGPVPGRWNLLRFLGLQQVVTGVYKGGFEPGLEIFGQVAVLVYRSWAERAGSKLAALRFGFDGLRTDFPLPALPHLRTNISMGEEFGRLYRLPKFASYSLPWAEEFCQLSFAGVFEFLHSRSSGDMI